MATRLQTVEELRPSVSAQCKAENLTKEWDCLPPTAQRVILTASATNGTYITTSLQPTLHRFLNARNVTAFQDNCALTYTGNNLYLPISFFKFLLQGHILAIPDPDALTGLSPLLTPPYFAGPTNAQKQAIRIQVILSMGQD